MEGAMSDASPLSGQRPVWLDDKTKSIMGCAIARERSLSRTLMTYIVTGLVFMLLLDSEGRIFPNDKQVRPGQI
jgi:hypothetical protein